MNPTDRQSIECFVRTTLGCKCPDDVFQSIAIDRCPAQDAAVPHTRLVIGDRLLIYVCEAQSGQAMAAALSALATRGRSERDARHFNRFRLVVASDHATQLLTDAGAIFASAAGDDDRAHLHILATEQLPDPLRVNVDVDNRAPARRLGFVQCR
jgi:hypothetical protein